MGTTHTGVIIYVIFILLLVFMLLVFALYLMFVWQQEKNKVKLMPRQPMTLCDKHGAYPSSSTLRLNVPADGREDLIVEQCPQCYYDRLKESKRIPS